MMTPSREPFVGIGAANKRNTVAIADAGRDSEIRYIGEVDAAPCGMKRMSRKLATKYERLHFCCEAGPPDYEPHRLITGLGHNCTVVAPLLIARKPSEGV